MEIAHAWQQDTLASRDTTFMTSLFLIPSRYSHTATRLTHKPGKHICMGSEVFLSDEAGAVPTHRVWGVHVPADSQSGHSQCPTI